MEGTITAPAPTSELVLLLNNSGLDTGKSQILSSRFADYFIIAEHWKNAAQQLTVTNENQTGLMKDARYGRLILREKRIAIEHTRKQLKEESLKEGRAIDAVAKLLTALIEPTEQFLLQQEEFAKRAGEQRDKQRTELIESRRNRILAYNPQASLSEEWYATASATEYSYALDEASNLWEAREELKAAEAEAQRNRDQRNRDELLLENQRLQTEAKEREQQRERERRQQEAEQQQLRDEAQQLRAAEAKRQKQQKADADLAEFQRNALATGPDKLKLVALADRIHDLSRGISCELVQGEKARGIVASVDITLDEIQNWLRQQADTL